MRKIIVLCVLTAFVQPVLAKLYKCKDAEGNTVYTDKICNDGKEIKLPPLHTYTPAKVTPPPPAKEDGGKEADKYELLRVVEPKNDATVYSNTGTVTVNYELKPALKTNKGHQFSVAVDGKQLKSRGVTNQIKLQNINRGSHTVQIFVVDRENNILLSSQTTIFHLRKESLLSPPPTGSPQKAPQTPAAPAAPRVPGL